MQFEVKVLTNLGCPRTNLGRFIIILYRLGNKYSAETSIKRCKVTCRVELDIVPGTAVSAVINLCVSLLNLSYILRRVTLFGRYLLIYRVVG